MDGIKRPKVLLLGNGILHACGGDNWSEFLLSISNRDKYKSTDDISRISCPEPLKAILVTDNDIDAAMAKKFRSTPPCNINDRLLNMLQRLLSMGFDHILTTNYTYEIEAAAIYPKRLTKYQLDRASTTSTGSGDRKYLLHTYNEIEYAGKSNKVWHIHGEAKRHSSTIIGHYYYGLLFSRIKEIADGISFKEFDANREPSTWIEAFITGDIYCVGFGFAFSEFDMWWLLNRKAREKTGAGKVVFYEQREEEQKVKVDLMQMLRDIDGRQLVEVKSLGFEKSEIDWLAYYESVIEDIEKQISN